MWDCLMIRDMDIRLIQKKQTQVFGRIVRQTVTIDFAKKIFYFMYIRTAPALFSLPCRVTIKKTENSLKMSLQLQLLKIIFFVLMTEFLVEFWPIKNEAGRVSAKRANSRSADYAFNQPKGDMEIYDLQKLCQITRWTWY